MLPNADGYEHDPVNLRRWVARTGLSQAAIARRLKIHYRTLKNYLRQKGGSKAPYTVFYSVAILALVNEKIGQQFPPRSANSGVS